MTDQRPAENWPADRIEWRKLEDLVPYANNPREHSPSQVEQIAKSIQKWGWTTPVLIDEEGQIIAGHGRTLAAKSLRMTSVPCMIASGWTDDEKKAYVIADNQLTLAGGWDEELLRIELTDLALGKFDLDALGFTDKALAALLKSEEREKKLAEADMIEDAKASTVSMLGDLWLLGEHRVLCGDSTDSFDVLNVMAGELADLIHADPPYGMGKEADGIANDNLYRDKLDAFQMSWLTEALCSARENASLYIWGNPEDLWRLVHCEDFEEFPDLTFRNEIVWAKGSGFGMASPDMHGYSPETERCLFFMRGPQFLGNVNKDQYWEGFEPLRLWLCAQRDAMGWTAKDINRITSSSMSGHWFGQSQFYVINRRNYDTLREAALGLAFEPTYDEILDRFGDGRDYRASLTAQIQDQRSYFDNVHDTMTDVWRFPRVHGDERFGHATPKPVAMIARAVVSSCPSGGVVFEPFLGTGSTLMAAAVSDRRCFGVELEPAYVDVVVRRWQNATGLVAVQSGTGETFDTVAREREAT